MERNISIQKYRSLYAKLILLYPIQYRNRFGEEMEQLFNDMCYEEVEKGNNLFIFFLKTFSETTIEIIKKNITMNIMKNTNMARIIIGTGLLLLIPLIAMQFTSEVVWTLSDFIFAAVVFLGTGFAYEFISSKGKGAYKLATALALLGGFLLIWINAAVGIIGDEGQSANLMFGIVLLVGLIGAIASRFKALGMSKTLFTMAALQALIVPSAYMFFREVVDQSLFQLIALNTIFVLIFAVSGMLFKRVSGNQI